MKYIPFYWLFPQRRCSSGPAAEGDGQRARRPCRGYAQHLRAAGACLRTSEIVVLCPCRDGPCGGIHRRGYMMAAYCDEAQEVTQSSAVYDGTGGAFPLRACRCGGTTKTRARNAGRGCSTVFSVATKPLKYLEDPSLETDYEKAQQDLMIAQAYALRAYCYLQLIKRWGGVPVLRESLGKDHDYSKDKRATSRNASISSSSRATRRLPRTKPLQWRQRLLSYGLPELSRAAPPFGLSSRRPRSMLPARCGPTTVPGLRNTPGNAPPKSPSRRSTSVPVTALRFSMPPRPFRTSPRPA